MLGLTGLSQADFENLKNMVLSECDKGWLWHGKGCVFDETKKALEILDKKKDSRAAEMRTLLKARKDEFSSKGSKDAADTISQLIGDDKKTRRLEIEKQLLKLVPGIDLSELCEKGTICGKGITGDESGWGVGWDFLELIYKKAICLSPDRIRCLTIPSQEDTSCLLKWDDKPHMTRNIGRFVKERILQAATPDPFLAMMKGKVVVDIGCGRSGAGYEIAYLAGAKAYIGVDPYNTFPYSGLDPLDRGKAIGLVSDLNKMQIERHIQFRIEGKPLKDALSYRFEDFQEFGDRIRAIPGFYVREDMLHFLMRLPSDSVVLLVSGIDDIVLQEKGSVTHEEYVTRVEKEAARVLHPEGVLVSHISCIQPEGLQKFCYEGCTLCYFKSLPSDVKIDSQVR
ncbi:MAG: hypothetical protein V1866_06935 [archaeon]